MWNDKQSKFYELKSLNGRANYLSDCIYLAIGFEKIPKALIPGNKLKRDNTNELTEEEEWPKTTTLLW